MEIVKKNQVTSTFDVSTKIKCLIEMALNKEVSWSTLYSTIDNLTPTLERSKQVNKLLLYELEKLQKIESENVASSIVDSETFEFAHEDELEEYDYGFNTNEVKALPESNSEEETFDFVEDNLEDVMSYENVTYAEDFSNVKEKDSSEADSQDEETLDESIEILNKFKGNFHTYVVDEFEGKSLNHKEPEESNKNKKLEVYSNEDLSTRKGSFKCKTCGKCFRYKFDLNKHVRIHTGEKPFQCRSCKKSFIQSNNLKLHERIHTGEKPFQCNSCMKEFARRDYLIKHERTHTGEKPYQCFTCKRNFSQSGELKIHERIHTGEKPYLCKICLKRFSLNSTLKNHERTHNGMKFFNKSTTSS